MNEHKKLDTRTTLESLGFKYDKTLECVERYTHGFGIVCTVVYCDIGVFLKVRTDTAPKESIGPKNNFTLVPGWCLTTMRETVQQMVKEL